MDPSPRCRGRDHLHPVEVKNRHSMPVLGQLLEERIDFQTRRACSMAVSTGLSPEDNCVMLEDHRIAVTYGNQERESLPLSAKLQLEFPSARS
jgi:hypothetical protein